MVREDARVHHIGLQSYAELEELLAALREENIGIDELAIEETDLEQVFLKIMRNPETAIAGKAKASRDLPVRLSGAVEP